MHFDSPNTFDLKQVLKENGLFRSLAEREQGHIVYAQGDPADAVFFLHQGCVKLTAWSEDGKEAVLAIVRAGQLFGEGCLSAQLFRHATAKVVVSSSVARIPKNDISRVLRNQPAFAEFFLSYVLSRNLQLEADLVDQLCNSCEKRLARLLILLSSPDSAGNPERFVPKLNQETLAAMVGTTRPRISILLNKFKSLGLIQSGDRLRINSSLADVVSNEGCQGRASSRRKGKWAPVM